MNYPNCNAEMWVREEHWIMPPHSDIIVKKYRCFGCQIEISGAD